VEDKPPKETLEVPKSGKNITSKSSKTPSDNKRIVGSGFSSTIDEKNTGNPMKNTEDLSTDVERGDKENIIDAKPSAYNVAVHLAPTEPPRDSPSNKKPETKEARRKHQPFVELVHKTPETTISKANED
jgi:hypothetical protein